MIACLLASALLQASVKITELYAVEQGDIACTTHGTHLTNQYIYSPYGVQKNLDHSIQTTASGKSYKQLSNAIKRPLNLTNNQMGYTGQPKDPSTGLMMLGGFRNYAPGIAHFIQPDTYNSFSNHHINNPDTYVNGNPISLTDISGHFAWNYNNISLIASMALLVVGFSGISAYLTRDAFTEISGKIVASLEDPPLVMDARLPGVDPIGDAYDEMLKAPARNFIREHPEIYGENPIFSTSTLERTGSSLFKSFTSRDSVDESSLSLERLLIDNTPDSLGGDVPEPQPWNEMPTAHEIVNSETMRFDKKGLSIKLRTLTSEEQRHFEWFDSTTDSDGNCWEFNGDKVRPITTKAKQVQTWGEYLWSWIPSL